MNFETLLDYEETKKVLNNYSNKWTLKPYKINQKDFYGKATIYKLNYYDDNIYTYDEENNGVIFYLMSYTTLVAKICGNKAFVGGWYSATTSRHINAFLQYFGFEKLNKQQMEKRRIWYK